MKYVTFLKNHKFNPNCRYCRDEQAIIMDRAPWYQDDHGDMLPMSNRALAQMQEETPIFYRLAYERFNKVVR